MRTWIQRVEERWLEFIQSLFHSHSRMLDDDEVTIYEAARAGNLGHVVRRLTDSPDVVGKRNKLAETPLAAALSIPTQMKMRRILFRGIIGLRT